MVGKKFEVIAFLCKIHGSKDYLVIHKNYEKKYKLVKSPFYPAIQQALSRHRLLRGYGFILAFFDV